MAVEVALAMLTRGAFRPPWRILRTFDSWQPVSSGLRRFA